MTEPAIIQVAIELKSIWTEHGKARRNRLRDFNAFHTYAHAYDPMTVAAAFLVVNAAEMFLSPLNLGRAGKEVTYHSRPGKGAAQTVRESIDIFRTIHLRSSAIDVPGLEALGVVVVEHDNIQPTLSIASRSDLLPKLSGLARPSKVAPVPPALKVGDLLHYSAMIQRICTSYVYRFG